MVRGSGSGRTTGDHGSTVVGHRCGPTPALGSAVGCGWEAGPSAVDPYPSLVIPCGPTEPHDARMPFSLTIDRSPRPVGSVLGETLVGTSLVMLGVWLVCLALTTRVVAILASSAGSGASAPIVGVLAWAAMLAAPTGLVLLGTDRLARMLAAVRAGLSRRPDHLAALPRDVTVIDGVRLDDGRTAPTLLVGGFGVAVVHGLTDATRRDGRRRTAPQHDAATAADPRDQVTRDAERLRRWFGQHEVDFVVRVYGAMVATDSTVTRSAACAVVTGEQLPAWVASLPRQRSLTTDRRTRLVGLLRDAK